MRRVRNGEYHTRVLLAVEGCPQVQAWIAAAREGKRCSAQDAQPIFPKDVIADPSFTPTRCGSGAASYVVRGYVRARHPAEIRKESEGRTLFSDPPVGKYRVCVESDSVGSTETVRGKLNIEAFREKELDGSGVAIAIMDSGIYQPRLKELLRAAPSFSVEDSWKPANLALGPGEYPVDHGTMCAYDSLIAAPKATLLDYPVLLARGANEHSAQATVSAAIDAYGRLAEMWDQNQNRDQKDPKKYRALVVNNSWGIFNRDLDFAEPGHPGRYIDNKDHPFHKIVLDLVAKNVDVLFAAGNCGSACPDNRCAGHTSGSIMGANAYAEVLTIAGCDVTDTRVEYSSQGPSIAEIPLENPDPSIPKMSPDKPDVTSYTHFKGSEIFGPGTPDGGTSTACAVAAGCVAAVRTKVSREEHPPAELFARLRNTARRNGRIGNSWDRNDGHGIMNPLEAVKDLKF